MSDAYLSGASRPNAPVHVRRVGCLGRMTLNRPSVLNALDLEMVRAMAASLEAWRDDPAIKAVVVDGAGDRAFCAGGDIRILHASGQAGDSRAETFWREEYALNCAIRAYPKPYVAIMDGVTMGGGVGVSVHGDFRVATERTLLAMPETGIGFYPDVGGTYVLPRLEAQVGVWMGLTGARLTGADAVAAGLATHYVQSEHVASWLAEAEAAALDDEGDALDGLLYKYETDAGSSTLGEVQDRAPALFAGDTVESIFNALDANHSEWAKTQAKTLRSKSPTSLKVTLRAMRETADLSFEDAMARELAISLKFLGCPDFYEGVRAAVIDKDRSPAWSPASLEAVSPDIVTAFFEAAPTEFAPTTKAGHGA